MVFNLRIVPIFMLWLPKISGSSIDNVATIFYPSIVATFYNSAKKSLLRSSRKDIRKSREGDQEEADTCGHWGRGSNKSERPHLVQNLSI